jgi:DNA-binding response OmpR family regulator
MICGMNGKRIILVEDDGGLLHSISFTLRRHGCSVVGTQNARDALGIIRAAALHHDPIDLLISDIQLPDMTGRELVIELAREEILPPTLIMTAFGTSSLFTELKLLGVRQCIDKPFTIEEFVGHVDAVLCGGHTKENPLSVV